MNIIRISILKALIGLSTIIAALAVGRHIWWNGKDVEWWVGAALIVSIIIGILALAYAYQLSVNDRHVAAVFAAGGICGGFTLVYFVVRDELPGSAGWAVIVSLLVAANLAVASTSVD